MQAAMAAIPRERLSALAQATARQILLREAMLGYSPAQTCARLMITPSYRLHLLTTLRSELDAIRRAPPS
jgi:DNA-binding CsgD family transcriptional regulator